MENRFNFNAIVTGYYDIDTPDEYSEFEPQIYLENVDIWSGGDIGISRDDLELAIKNQYPNLEKSQFNQIMKFFEDNSNSIDNEAYLTILPHKIIQCTGLKDKNGKLVYQGDILGDIYEGLYIHYCEHCHQFQLYSQGYGCMACNGDIHWIEVVEDNKKLEVIGNIYQDEELLNEIHS